jgi:hypothetical protein
MVMNFINKKIICASIFAIFAITSFSLMANVFENMPGECNIVGSINLNAIKKVQSINDAINENKNNQDAIYKSLKKSGLSIDNINNIYFGMFLNKLDKPEPSFLALIKTKLPCNIKNFAKNAPKKDKKITITTEIYNNKTIYIIVNKKAISINNENIKTEAPIYCTSLNENLVALGTRDYIDKCIDLSNDKSNSILNNKEMMKLIGNQDRVDMVWLATIVPKEFTQPVTSNSSNAADKTKKPEIPNIKKGILALNYKNNSLTLSGQIFCNTAQDVQKIMLPVQVLLGIFAMNPNSGINPQDIILKPNDKILNVNITIPEKALENIVKEQEKNDKDAKITSPSSKNIPIDNTYTDMQ